MVEKNKKKLLDKSQRVWYNMNTGMRVHKDAKHPSRNKIKKDFKKMLDRLENLWYNKDRKSQEGDNRLWWIYRNVQGAKVTETKRLSR